MSEPGWDPGDLGKNLHKCGVLLIVAQDVTIGETGARVSENAVFSLQLLCESETILELKFCLKEKSVNHKY